MKGRVQFRRKVGNPPLMAATAAVGLFAFPLLQPDWVTVKQQSWTGSTRTAPDESRHTTEGIGVPMKLDTVARNRDALLEMLLEMERYVDGAPF